MSTINVKQAQYQIPTLTANSFEIVRPFFDLETEILYLDVNLYYIDPLNPAIYKTLISKQSLELDNSAPNYYFNQVIDSETLTNYILEQLKLTPS